jgi:hypothetical protein
MNEIIFIENLFKIIISKLNKAFVQGKLKNNPDDNRFILNFKKDQKSINNIVLKEL